MNNQDTDKYTVIFCHCQRLAIISFKLKVEKRPIYRRL